MIPNGTNKQTKLPISQFIFNPLFTELLPHAIHDRLFDRQTFSNWHKDWVEYRVLRLSETFYILSHIAASLGKKRVETEKTWEKNWDKEKKNSGNKRKKEKEKKLHADYKKGKDCDYCTETTGVSSATTVIHSDLELKGSIPR